MQLSHILIINANIKTVYRSVMHAMEKNIQISEVV